MPAMVRRDGDDETDAEALGLQSSPMPASALPTLSMARRRGPADGGVAKFRQCIEPTHACGTATAPVLEQAAAGASGAW
jgi:hypothetical protein